MALDEKSHQRIAALFTVRLPERMKALGKERSQMLRMAMVRGSAHGSYVEKNLHQLCAQELEVLVALAWQDIRRVVVTHEVKPNDGLAGDLRKEVRVLLSTPYAEIQKQYEHWCSVQGYRPLSLETAMQNSYTKIDPEIDHFTDGMSTVSTHPNRMTSIVVQGNAQVGAIVACPGASAQVTQQNIVDNRQEILKALDHVLNAIRSSSYHDELAETQGLIEDARAELGKDKPNSLKLASAIAGIGTAINMLAGLKPAYESLRSMGAILGITLP